MAIDVYLQMDGIKERLWCSFSPSDGYRCYFGFDLRTGKSIAGASCQAIDA